LVPGDPLKTIPLPLQRVFEPIGIVLMISDAYPLPANIPLTANILFVSFDLEDTVVFNLHLQTTILGAKDATCFVNRSHRSSRILL
jgi:hypothetical protein